VNNTGNDNQLKRAYLPWMDHRSEQINQSINRSIDQSINRSIDQSINQSRPVGATTTSSRIGLEYKSQRHTAQSTTK